MLKKMVGMCLGYPLVNLALLELYSGGPLTMHWTMECGNDIINQTSEQAPVPEPATVSAGLLGFAGLSRKKIKKQPPSFVPCYQGAAPKSGQPLFF